MLNYTNHITCNDDTPIAAGTNDLLWIDYKCEMNVLITGFHFHYYADGLITPTNNPILQCTHKIFTEGINIFERHLQPQPAGALETRYLYFPINHYDVANANFYGHFDFIDYKGMFVLEKGDTMKVYISNAMDTSAIYLAYTVYMRRLTEMAMKSIYDEWGIKRYANN